MNRLEPQRAEPNRGVGASEGGEPGPWRGSGAVGFELPSDLAFVEALSWRREGIAAPWLRRGVEPGSSGYARRPTWGEDRHVSGAAPAASLETTL